MAADGQPPPAREGGEAVVRPYDWDADLRADEEAWRALNRTEHEFAVFARKRGSQLRRRALSEWYAAEADAEAEHRVTKNIDEYAAEARRHYGPRPADGAVKCPLASIYLCTRSDAPRLAKSVEVRASSYSGPRARVQASDKQWLADANGLLAMLREAAIANQDLEEHAAENGSRWQALASWAIAAAPIVWVEATPYRGGPGRPTFRTRIIELMNAARAEAVPPLRKLGVRPCRAIDQSVLSSRQ